MAVLVLPNRIQVSPPRWLAHLCLAYVNRCAGKSRHRTIRMTLPLRGIPEIRLREWEEGQADNLTTLHQMESVGGLGLLLRLFNDAYVGAPDYRRAGWVQVTALQASRSYDPSLIWIACRSGMPVGFCMARLSGENARVTGLGVLPSFRKQGVGGMLMRHAIAEVRRRGAALVDLDVCEGNEAPIRVYRRLGFRSG